MILLSKMSKMVIQYFFFRPTDLWHDSLDMEEYDAANSARNLSSRSPLRWGILMRFKFIEQELTRVTHGIT